MSKEIFNKIVAKLQRLDEYLLYLHEIQKVNRETFVNDFHFFGLAERYLQLSIEVILDVGKLMVVAFALRKPEDSQDIFNVLTEHKILSEQLSQRLAGICGFRNILVHDYEKIDRKLIYERLQNNLSDFVNFKKTVVRFLKNQ